MNANKPRGIQKALIQKELHALLRIVEQSQRCNGAGDKAQQLHQVFFRGEAKGTYALRLTEGF